MVCATREMTAFDTSGTYGAETGGSVLAIESTRRLAYGELSGVTRPLRAGNAAGTEALEASSLTDAAIIWNSRSGSAWCSPGSTSRRSTAG